MKKIINFIGCLALLVTMQSLAQNVASANGNWDSCATWGTPAIGITKGNDGASAKTINNNVTINMNIGWNAQSVTFGAAGAIDFQGTNGLDLNVAGGAALGCTTPAAIGTLNCGSVAQTGRLYAGSPVIASNGVRLSISYSGANSGSYIPQSIGSTGVTGLNASLDAGTLSSSGTLTLIVTGTPSAIGTANFSLTIGGKTCNLAANVENGNAIQDPGFDTATPWSFTLGTGGSGAIDIQFGMAEFIGRYQTTVFVSTLYQNVTTVSTNAAKLSFDVAIWDDADGSKLEILYNGVLYAFMNNTRSINANTGQVIAQNGASGASVNVTHTANNTSPTRSTVTLTLPNGIPASGTFLIRYSSSSVSTSPNYSDEILVDNFFLSRGY